jgi:hypothetical protein
LIEAIALSAKKKKIEAIAQANLVACYPSTPEYPKLPS